jgi:hypothetical protein
MPKGKCERCGEEDILVYWDGSLRGPTGPVGLHYHAMVCQPCFNILVTDPRKAKTFRKKLDELKK